MFTLCFWCVPDRSQEEPMRPTPRVALLLNFCLMQVNRHGWLGSSRALSVGMLFGSAFALAVTVANVKGYKNRLFW